MQDKSDSPPAPVLQHSVPLFWPLAAAAAMGQMELELFQKNLKFVMEAQKVDHGLRPGFATVNTVLLELHTQRLRAFGETRATGVPTLVIAPYAGHSAAIADYHNGQSLVQTLLAAGLDRVLVTDWRSARADGWQRCTRRVFPTGFLRSCWRARRSTRTPGTGR